MDNDVKKKVKLLLFYFFHHCTIVCTIFFSDALNELFELETFILFFW